MVGSIGSLRLRRPRFNQAVIGSIIGVLMIVAGLVVVSTTGSEAAGREQVRLVNATGETLWIGAGVNADGSRPLTGLPKLAPGETKTVAIPMGEGAGHWRGRIFARQRCSGESGSTFKCLVGDCGIHADRCDTGAQPVSLAEFNFDRAVKAGPYYNVSYVDALSVAMTIDTPGPPKPDMAGTCVRRDCSGGQMLAACPDSIDVVDPVKGDRINCVNPARDSADSVYTRALREFGARAYLWSTHDRVPGNQTVYTCPGCTELAVTFHSKGAPSDTSSPTDVPGLVVASVEHRPGPGESGLRLRGLAGKCVDVPDGKSADGAQVRLHHCNGTAAQRFTRGPGDTLKVLGKCLDVAWASRDDGAKVQIAWCNNGPAQVWVLEGKKLRNPHSGKCLDVRERSTADRTPLQIWTCNPAGQDNQSWQLAGV